MIAAVYARRSDDQNERDEDAKSITRQVERARNFAQKKGWTIDESSICNGTVFTEGMVPVRGFDTFRKPVFSLKLAFDVRIAG